MVRMALDNSSMEDGKDLVSDDRSEGVGKCKSN